LIFQTIFRTKSKDNNPNQVTPLNEPFGFKNDDKILRKLRKLEHFTEKNRLRRPTSLKAIDSSP
jgi:hypothetical protein